MCRIRITVFSSSHRFNHLGYDHYLWELKLEKVSSALVNGMLNYTQTNKTRVRCCWSAALPDHTNESGMVGPCLERKSGNAHIGMKVKQFFTVKGQSQPDFHMRVHLATHAWLWHVSPADSHVFLCADHGNCITAHSEYAYLFRSES